MGVYRDQILPRVTDRVMDRKDLREIRAWVASGLSGEVLEIGFGSGLNVPHYPAAVTRVLAVDPATVGRTLAAGRVEASPVAVEYLGLDGRHLPIDSASVDHVLITWTLCTIPHPERALAEVRRVLCPGGRLHFVEHGRAPDPAVARWQDHVTRPWRRVAGGCHLNRRIDRLISGSGLDLTTLRTYYADGPKIFGYMFEGVATTS